MNTQSDEVNLSKVLSLKPTEMVQKYQTENPPEKWRLIDQVLQIHFAGLLRESIDQRYPYPDDLRSAIRYAAELAGFEGQEGWKMRWEGWLVAIRLTSSNSLKQYFDVLLDPEKIIVLKAVPDGSFRTLDEISKITGLAKEKVAKIVDFCCENKYLTQGLHPLRLKPPRPQVIFLVGNGKELLKLIDRWKL